MKVSNKPTKKSDAKKAWMKPRKGPGRLVAPECHLIVSEGEKTEPNYFKAMADRVNAGYRTGRNGAKQRESIRFRTEGVARNTTGVLEKARSLAEEWAQELGHPVSHVWVVYDLDDFDRSRFDDVPKRCEQLTQGSDESTKFHALWSNQCFELWLLMHFEYLQSDLHRSDYIGKLNKHYKNSMECLGRITKTMRTLFRSCSRSLARASRIRSDCLARTPQI